MQIRRSSAPFLLALFLVAAASSTLAAQSANNAPATEAVSPVLSAAQRALYVGVYEMQTPEGTTTIDIFEEGERLMGRPARAHAPSPLTPLGEHGFRPELMPEAVLRFVVEGPGKKASAFAIEFSDGGSILAVRKE